MVTRKLVRVTSATIVPTVLAMVKVTQSDGDQNMNRSPRVIDLSLAPGEQAAWGRPKWMVYAWAATELLVVSNPWQISSRLRIMALRLFGAKIGHAVIFRPRTRVKFPWKLQIGDRSWIGEGVWIHNQDDVIIGCDAVVSQDTFITTGSHAFRRDMALLTKPVRIEDGAWVTSRVVVLGGTVLGKSALVAPQSVVSGSVAENTMVRGNPASFFGFRFDAAESNKK